MYGSGKPALWGTGESLSSPQQQQQQNQGQSSNLNSRYKNSYQQGPTDMSSYQAPRYPDDNTTNATYAQKQTTIVEDSVKTQYQAEGAANTVLSQLQLQRGQLQGAHDNTNDLKLTTEQAKRELADLEKKRWSKKRKLQGIIATLATLDFLLFLRLIQCGGSFFCW